MLIREKDKQTLLRIFSQVSIPIEVWAYGSRINGTAHEGSNLNLVIRSHTLTPIPTDVYHLLYEKIKESTIPILVELIDWTRLPASWRVNIEKEYEVLFDNRNKFQLKLS